MGSLSEALSLFCQYHRIPKVAQHNTTYELLGTKWGQYPLPCLSSKKATSRFLAHGQCHAVKVFT